MIDFTSLDTKILTQNAPEFKPSEYKGISLQNVLRTDYKPRAYSGFLMYEGNLIKYYKYLNLIFINIKDS